MTFVVSFPFFNASVTPNRSYTYRIQCPVLNNVKTYNTEFFYTVRYLDEYDITLETISIYLGAIGEPNIIKALIVL